jgi:hypothetical protein
MEIQATEIVILQMEAILETSRSRWVDLAHKSMRRIILNSGITCLPRLKVLKTIEI